MADSDNTPVETLDDIPSTRGIRDWFNTTGFATFDSQSLPNGITFGYENGKYGYYDSNGNFNEF